MPRGSGSCGRSIRIGVGLAPVRSPPLIGALILTDNFDDNSISASWTTGQLVNPSASTTGVTVAETNQRLEVTGPASTAAERYSGLVSVSTYNLIDTAVFVKIANAASIGGSQLAFVVLGVDASNHYRIQIQGGAFVELLKSVGGAVTSLSAQTSVGSDVWFRLRHTSAGDQIIVDSAPSTASDPPVESDWTRRVAATRDAAVGEITAWKVALNGGLYASVASPTTIQFDGFNTATTGPDVTLALTGQALAVSQGSLLASTALALTGVGLTAAQGNVAPQDSLALTGQSLTAARGSVAPAVSVSLTGQSSIAAQDSASPSNSEALSGQALAVTQGSIVSAPGATLSGQALSSGAGSVFPDTSPALTGQATGLAQGLTGPATSTAINGQSLTAARGTVSVAATDVTAALTGLSISTAQGTVSGSAIVALLGRAATVDQGTLGSQIRLLFTPSVRPGLVSLLDGAELSETNVIGPPRPSNVNVASSAVAAGTFTPAPKPSRVNWRT